MADILDVPDALRDWGLPVRTYPGWESRGVGGGRILPRGILTHDDVIPATVSHDARLRVLAGGRPDLQGPLGHAAVDHAGGWEVFATGRANHAGRGRWQGITDGNGQLFGVECAWYPGEPRAPAQIDGLVRGCAAICDVLGFSERMVAQHREYALPPGRKADMHWHGPLREAVALHLLARAGFTGAAVPWTPAGSRVTHQLQEEAMQVIELVTPPLDPFGRGWLPLDGADGRPLVPWGSLVSAIPQGSNPARDAAYWPAAEVGMQQEGGHTLLTVQGAVPGQSTVLYLVVAEAA